MNAILLILIIAAWVAIGLAFKDICRIKRYGYIKKEHFGVEQ